MRNYVTGSKKIWVHLAASVVLLFGMGAPGRVKAQAVGATLSGTVTDQSGGVVPKADVAIMNTATSDTRTVSTNADGIYSAPNLQPGPYSVTVTAAGFSKAVQTGLTLTVGASQTLNLTMQVGQSNQTVEVTAEALTVNLANAEIGALTTEAAIKELPLNGRSWSDLANLTSGVYQLHTQPGLETRDRFTRGYGVQLSISGNRPQQNNYRVDGISINDPGNGGPGSVLGSNSGVDAIAEFSVLTTSYSTEYGRASGGIINATTKSGTNQFHGTAYEFLRNSWLDAKNFFDDPNSKIPGFRRNQFGASAGGPIIKNKTFVFGDYEGLRQALGISTVSQVPSVTGAAAADPKVAPYLTALFPIGGTLGGKQVCSITHTGDPFHDNCSFGANQVSTENYYIIRADHDLSGKDRVSGTVFRDKASTGTPDKYNNQIVNTATSETFATIAETHSFSSNFVNSARFGYNRITQGGPAGSTAVNPAAADLTFGFFPQFDAPQVAIGSPNSIKFSGGLTSNKPQVNTWNSFQGYNDAFWTKGKHSFKFGANAERIQLNVIRSARPGGIFVYNSWREFLNNCGYQTTLPNCAGGTGAVSITTDIPGTLAPEEIRQTVFGVYFQDDWRIRPNLTINLGLRYEPTTVPNDPKGRNSTLASIYDTTGAQLPLCGMAFTDASGNPTCNARNGPLFQNNTRKDFDPRVGFAWDPQGNGKMSIRGGAGIYDQLPLPAFMGSTSNGNTTPFLISGSNSNLAPGSFGEAGSFGPCPVAPAPGGAWPPGTSAACQVAAAGGDRAAFIERAPKRAYVIQYNLSVQREIAPNTTFMIGYVGSHGVHGTTQVDDVNEVLPINIGGQYLWPCENAINPFPAGGGSINDCVGKGQDATGNRAATINHKFGRLPATFFRNSSLYNGMQVQLTKAMSHGFQATAGFTWQKSIDTASGAVISDSVITAISTLNWFDPKLTRAVSDFNDAKVFTLNYLWDIPTPKSWSGLVRSAVGGWELGGIFSASSGEPFTPLLAGDALGLNNTDAFAYPNRVSGPGCNNPVNSGNVNNYIKLQCFVIPPVVTVNGTHYIPLGNVGRNILTGPGLMNFDFSLVKNTKIPRISEAFNIQLRLDVFNLFNHPNFNPPVTNEFVMDPTSVTPGTVAMPGPTGPCTANNLGNSGCVANAGALDGGDQTATNSRQMQLSVKFVW
jgi:hypothetical protein